jgi:hypothetical protein
MDRNIPLLFRPLPPFFIFETHPHPLIFYLIPHPLLLKEKGSKRFIIINLAPLLKERGWGEVINKKGHPFRQPQHISIYFYLFQITFCTHIQPGCRESLQF